MANADELLPDSAQWVNLQMWAEGSWRKRSVLSGCIQMEGQATL